MSHSPAIVWLRHDLRLSDQPALRAAIRHGGPVIPVFIWSPSEEGDWPCGAASRWWLHHSLSRLQESLRSRGSGLIVRRGSSLETLRELLRETGADSVFWNRRYEPATILRDQEIKSALAADGVTVQSFNGSLLFEPWDVQTQSRTCFQVFTPFWRKCCELGIERETLPTPRAIAAPDRWPTSVDLDSLKLLPKLNWDSGFHDRWSPGEDGAQQVLRTFVGERIEDYAEERNRPDRIGTSSLSPHLHFGEVSPLQVWEAVTAKYGPPTPANKGVKSGPMTFLSEIGWREFAHHILYHFPQTSSAPLREHFADFPWQSDPEQEQAWRRGLTGYPIVDAGLRELWTTGWMHNRVRMIAGSFLTKDLLSSWRTGAAWFWDTLVDADLANNTLGWQWISGCGADAAPYFRIFNPVSQGEKFDPRGDYVRRWVPELSRLPNEFIHCPWEASVAVLKSADVTLGKTYPERIVDHGEARKRALEALARTKRS